MVLALATPFLAWGALAAFAALPVDLKSTLEEVRPALKSKLQPERIGALRKIAAVSKEGSGPPSPDVARALQIGLTDAEFEVRSATVVLLVDHQDAETALTLLLPVLKRTEDDVKTWVAKTARAFEKIFDQSPPAKGAGDELGKAIASQHLLCITLAALGRIPDARSEDALIASARRTSLGLPARLCEHTCRALLEIRTQRAMQCVLEVLAQHETVAKRDKDVNARERSEAVVKQIATLLSSFASNAGVPEPADGAGALSHRWRQWTSANPTVFRESLEKVSGTLELDLRPQFEALLTKSEK